MKVLKRISTLFVCSLAGALLTTGSPGYAATAKKPAAKNKVAVKKPKVNPYTFQFLPVEYIAKLGFESRVKYVKALRALIVESETARNVMSNSFFADVAPTGDGSELYALSFGGSVYADEQCPDIGDGGRGRFCTDVCISGYGLSNYPQRCSGKRQPFMCQQAKCTSSEGPGVQCNYFLSGIPAGEKDDSCVPHDFETHSTKICDENRDKLSQRNATRVQAAVTAARGVFDSHRLLKAADLTSPATAKIINDLMNTAYDDNAFAELVLVVATYKKNNIQMPISGLEKFLGSIDLSKPIDKAAVPPSNIAFTDQFINNLSETQKALVQVFHDYTAHCNHALSQCEVKMLKNPQWALKAAQAGHTAQQMEDVRLKAVANIDAGKETVRNVLEKEECDVLDAREASLMKKIADVASTIPSMDTNQPVPGPIQVHPPAPPAPSDDEKTVSTQCREDVGRAENHLIHPAARCMICLAERAMARAADDHNYDKSSAEYAYHQQYTASTKWFSLLSTMVLACNDGVANDTAMHSNVLGCYMEAFGHCSDDVYDWDPTGKNSRAGEDFTGSADDISQCDNWLVDEWADRGYWNKMDDKVKQQNFADKYVDGYERNGCGRVKPRGVSKLAKAKIAAPDLNNEFVRVYGLSYETAKKIFCNPKPSGDKPAPAVCSKEWMNEARSRMATQHREITKGKYNASAQALYTCLDDSYKNANELYSAGEPYCTKTANLANDHDHWSTLIDQAEEGIPNVVSDTGSCYSVAQYDERSGHRGALIVDPRRQKNVSHMREFIPNADGGDKKLLDNWSYCAPLGCQAVNPLEPEKYKYFSYSYEDKNACTPAHDDKTPVSQPPTVQ